MNFADVKSNRSIIGKLKCSPAAGGKLIFHLRLDFVDSPLVSLALFDEKAELMSPEVMGLW